MPPKSLKIHVTVWRLRRMFNLGCYVQRVERGELTASTPKAGEPDKPELRALGAISCAVSYCNHANQEVARVHFYLMPDGSIGGSGFIDPKRLWRKRFGVGLVRIYSVHGQSGIARRGPIKRWFYRVWGPYDQALALKVRNIAPRYCACRVR